MALGIVLVLAGAAVAGVSLWGVSERGRPRDLLFAALAPLGVLAALIGGVTVLAPGWLR
jgi:hypothetical protein